MTGNPFSASVDPVAGKVVEAWRYDWEDEKHGISTIPPEPLTDRAISEWRSTNKERLVVHYMQPHTPLKARPDWFNYDMDVEGWDGGKDDITTVWTRARRGEIEKAELRDAFQDNLRWVLESVETLRTSVDANIVITSDHGNAFGEYGLWGHPRGVQIPTVRRVPWVEVDGENTNSYSPTVSTEKVSTDTEDQLSALGYK